jgi:hypothetical protein
VLGLIHHLLEVLSFVVALHSALLQIGLASPISTRHVEDCLMLPVAGLVLLLMLTIPLLSLLTR